jgi:hypothetical protein
LPFDIVVLIGRPGLALVLAVEGSFPAAADYTRELALLHRIAANSTFS